MFNGGIEMDEGIKDRPWADQLDAHDAYWESMTRDLVDRDQRRQAIERIANRKGLIAPHPAPAPLEKIRPPFHETLIAMLGGAFVMAIILTMVGFFFFHPWG